MAALSGMPGVRRVKGRVAAAESIYDFNPAPGGWSWGDLGNYYGAGVYDINFNDNKYQIYVTGRPKVPPAVNRFSQRTRKGYSCD